MTERRVKVLYVSSRVILDLLNGLSGEEMWYWREGPELPAGTQVLAVSHSFERNSLAVLLEHPSWDIVPDGMFPPQVYEENCCEMEMRLKSDIQRERMEARGIEMPKATPTPGWRDNPPLL